MKKVYSRQSYTIISCQISHFNTVFPLFSSIKFAKTSKIKIKLQKALVVSSHLILAEGCTSLLVWYMQSLGSDSFIYGS